MMTCGLFVELEAARDQEASVERFLEEVLPMLRTEPESAWFALRLRRYHYGILDAFPDEAARVRHLLGPVAQELGERIPLFARPPVFHAVDILADKLPTLEALGGDRKGLLLRVTPRRGRESELEELMRSTQSIVDAEPDTTAWFALRYDNGDFGFFDAFPSRRARRKHLLGKAPRELVKHFRLLGGLPRGSLVDVQAETFAT
ncbi:MAG TPA: hypothetical protein VIV11_16350 [Kofleriaceae bacterium]